MAVLLNVDAGERPDEPEALYAVADLLNVACGGHAGDAVSMARVVEAARRAGVRVGAHPSYPDRADFGRRTLDLAPAVLARSVREQCDALRGVAGQVHHLKLHGALYHDADRDPDLAARVVDAALAALGACTVLGPAGGALQAVAAARGLPYLVEGFADRGVGPDGRLIPRGQPGALLTDPAAVAARAAALAAEGRVHTVCVHGDTPGAVSLAGAVRAVLT